MTLAFKQDVAVVSSAAGATCFGIWQHSGYAGAFAYTTLIFISLAAVSVQHYVEILKK